MNNAFWKKHLPKLVGFGLNTIGLVAPRKSAKLALDIFCKPRGGSIKHYHEKFLNSFEKKKIKSGEIEVQTYFLDKKSPYTILLCHGWESNSARWKKLVRYLENCNVNIAALDGPAHGASGGDKFTGLIYAQMIHDVVQNYQPKVIVGHSVGAFSCAASLYFYGKATLDHFIILASPDTMDEITQQYFAVIGLSKKVAKVYYASFVDWFGNPVDYYSTSKFMTDIDINGFIIHDKDDDINYYHNATSINKSWKNSSLHTTKGLGHGLQSPEVYEKIKTYLEEELIKIAKT